MFARVTYTLPAGAERTVDLEPGVTTIAAPSGWGKSTLIDAVVSLVTGEAGPRAQGVTVKGATLAVDGGKRTVARVSEGPAKYSTAEDYRSALRLPHADLLRLIVHPEAWIDLYRGGVAGRRALRDALLRALPVGSVPDVVRELMGEDWRDGDPCDPKGAEAALTEANRRATAAKAAHERDAEALTRAEAAVAACAEVADATEAREVLARFETWDTYDRKAAEWVAYDATLAAWQAAAPGDEPAYSAEEHQAARVALDAARRKAAEEERKALAEAARVKAEADAAARAQAADPPPAPPPTAPLFGGAYLASHTIATPLGTHTIRYGGTKAAPVPTHLDSRPLGAPEAA